MPNVSVNPWLGLKSYDEEDKLFGRKKETDDVANMIINGFNSIIYGKSGIGKTSLLKAGVFPLLRYEDFYPIYIRLEHDITDGNSYDYYLAQIESAITLPSRGIIVEKRDECVGNRSLATVLNSGRYHTSRGIKLTPVFVFDQFEEIFTLNESQNIDSITKFFKDISIILNGDAAGQNYRIVFCLREDYLYCIEKYSETIPAFKRNRYRLQDLSMDEAYEVITMPQPGLVDHAVAQSILKKLVSENLKEVNATILSLYMSQLFERMIASENVMITSEIIHQFGDDIISTFYADSIKEISSKSISYLEEHLITTGGYRHNIPLEDALTAGVLLSEINLLKEKRILNVQPKSNKVDYIEYTHDVLCPIIVKHRNDRQMEYNALKTRKVVFKGLLLASSLFVIVAVLVWNTIARADAESESVRLKEMNDSIIVLKNLSEIRKDSLQIQYGWLQIQKDSIELLNSALGKEKDSLFVLLREKQKQERAIKLKDENLAQLNAQLQEKVDSLQEVYKILLNRMEEERTRERLRELNRSTHSNKIDFDL